MKSINWIKILQGGLGILFGILLIVWPIKSLILIAWVLGLYLVINSVLLMLLGLLSPKNDHKGMTILLGGITLLAGIVIMSGTASVLSLLVLIIALWMLISGIIQILLAVFDRSIDEESNGMRIFSGLATLFIGLLLFVYPTQTIGFVQIVAGLGILAGGLSTFVYAFKSK